MTIYLLIINIITIIFNYQKNNNNIKLLYFSFVKKLPNTYLDTIYNQVNDLVNEIVNYANYRGNTTII